MNAPRYIVTNGFQYMTKCSGNSLGPKEQAYCWKTQRAAETQVTVKNRCHPEFSWRVEEVKSEDATLQVFDTEDRAFKNSPEFVKMAEVLYDCVHSIGRIKEMIEQCSRGLSEQDKIQEDLLHKIEFESTGRGQAGHLCVLLRECRKKRRGYKDMLTMLQGVSTVAINNVSTESLNNIQERMNGRMYSTRSKEVF